MYQKYINDVRGAYGDRSRSWSSVLGFGPAVPANRPIDLSLWHACRWASVYGDRLPGLASLPCRPSLPFSSPGRHKYTCALSGLPGQSEHRSEYDIFSI